MKSKSNLLKEHNKYRDLETLEEKIPKPATMLFKKQANFINSGL